MTDRYGGNINKIEKDGKLMIDIIMAFNRDGILDIDEIYSRNDKTGQFKLGGHDHYHVEITGYSTLFRPKQKIWKYLWKIPHAWTSGVGSSDLSDHISKILLIFL